MTKQRMPLTDPQWAAIAPATRFTFFRPPRRPGSNASENMNCDKSSTLFCGSCERAATGPPERWRNLPQGWPHWQAVYYYFDRWKQDGTFEQINSALNQLDRKQVGKNAYPSLLCIDAQSIKLHPMICEHRSLDTNKRVNGRKREFVVDTDGRLWVVDVHAAN